MFSDDTCRQPCSSTVACIRKIRTAFCSKNALFVHPPPQPHPPPQSAPPFCSQHQQQKLWQQGKHAQQKLWQQGKQAQQKLWQQSKQARRRRRQHNNSPGGGAEVRLRLSQPLVLGVKLWSWIYISEIWYSYHNVAQDIIKNFHNTEIVLNTTQYPPNQFENFRIRPPSQRALG